MHLSRRDLVKSAGALALAGAIEPAATVAAAAPQGTPVDVLEHVHPELRPAAQMVMQMSQKMPPLSAATLASLRKSGPPPIDMPDRPDVPVSQHRVAVKTDSTDVAVYVVNSGPGPPRPAILHTHGGGFVMGTADSLLAPLKMLAAELDCTIATVDYRLAPETRCTGSLEDNYAALRWLHSSASELNVDPHRIALMGESAGGGHAAILALTARDRGEVPVLFQCLIQAMLDDRTASSRTVPPHIGQILWTAEANRFGWESFLGQKPGLDSAPRNCVPARVENLAGLPPAFIGVGAIDLFVDEDIDYARRLIADGVQTELVVAPGAFHGFDIIAPDTSLARQFTEAKLHALRSAFAAA